LNRIRMQGVTWKKMIPQATRKTIQNTTITPELCEAQLSAIYRYHLPRDLGGGIA
jgi:hypothetical protein